MTNTSPDPIAQLVAKYQSNGHQAASAQQQPASHPQQKKSWTGFAERTLWDWLGVLLVPLILGVGTIIVTAQQSAISQSQHKSDLSIANNQLQESLLKTFRDDINRLVFDQHLLAARPDDPVQIMAQSYTNDALRKLDISRRAMLVQFLSDLHLITYDTKDSSLISLRGAHLYGTELQGANLSKTELQEANLDDADLYGDILKGAKLDDADLQGADLEGADLQGADLEGADLERTDLERARVTPEQLAKAWRLKGATLQDGSHYPSSSYPIPNHREPPD